MFEVVTGLVKTETRSYTKARRIAEDYLEFAREHGAEVEPLDMFDEGKVTFYRALFENGTKTHYVAIIPIKD